MGTGCVSAGSLRLVPLFLPALALLCACPHGPAPIDAGVDAGPSITPIETCNRLSTARCTLLSRCYAAFNRDAPEDCDSLEQARCLAEYETLKPSFDNGSVVIDPEQVDNCEQRMLTSACPPSFPPTYPNIAAHPFSDCGWQTGLLIGQLNSMADCVNGVDCKPGLTCIKVNGVCLGSCGAFAADGEPCGFGCAAGLRCSDNGTPLDTNDDFCTSTKGVNEACNDSSECDPELVCSVTCRPRGHLGEACFFDPLRLSTCDPGLACDVTPYVNGMLGTCVAPQGEFSPCHFHWSCQPGLVCADIGWAAFPGSAPTPGFCRPPGAMATNCSSTLYALYVGDPCIAGTACSTSTNKCDAIPTMGEACDPAAQTCAGVGVYCKPSGTSSGQCTGPAGIGDRCAFQVDANNVVTIPCQSGFCDTTSTFTCRPAFVPDHQSCTQDGECVSGRCAVQQDRTLQCAMACN
jgi:hypothetical protein